MEKTFIFIKENKKLIFIALALSIVITLLIGGAVGLVIYANRAELFDYFAREYLADFEERKIASSGNERIIFSEESAITDVVDKVNPAVVSIVVTKDVPVVEQYFENFDPFEEFFRDPFGGGFNFQVPRTREKGTEKREVGGGSGFFVSKDGLVVTNRHVVSDTKAEYTVFTNDGKKYEAEVLARDPILDIAILKSGAKNTPYLTFGDSEKVKLGQTVIAIGNALGEFRNSVSVGVVSGLSRSVVAGDDFGNSELLEQVIQTDAAINPGNSGGPLLDVKGNVIGVNVAVSRGAENIGFALPANLVKSTVSSVVEHGEIIRPYLGVRYTRITPSLKKKNNLSVDYGALVMRGDTPEDLAVIPGSPADKAGIVENDIILEIDGIKLEEGKSFGLLIRQKSVGDTITLKIVSKGKEKVVSATLEKAPKN
ncbi:MAG: trypsin-like peptidase domain-containing protein [Patescibacteria group bacterium]|mgnify:FL=1